MSTPVKINSDLSAAFMSMITDTSPAWVMEQQPAAWLPDAWEQQWQAEPRLPHAEVINELQAEYQTHSTIRRSFVFSYSDRSPLELFIATMAWGFGNDGRGPWKVREMLTPTGARNAIESVVETVRRDGAAAAYRHYFSHSKLPQLNLAFVTKLLYFAGYQARPRPRPLIYDSNVAHAIARIPQAPVLPCTCDRVRTTSYQTYCEWAEATAGQNETEPIVIEWALFTLGRQISQAIQG